MHTPDAASCKHLNADFGCNKHGCRDRSAAILPQTNDNAKVAHAAFAGAVASQGQMFELGFANAGHHLPAQYGNGGGLGTSCTHGVFHL